MDPMTLILTALMAGVTAGTTSIASEAIKDAYHGLKTLILHKFETSPDAKLALTKFEEEPDIWKTPLKKALDETKADRSDEIIAAAQRIMDLVNSQEAAKGKYNVQLKGSVQGFVQGDHAKVDMTFGSQPEEK